MPPSSPIGARVVSLARVQPREPSDAARELVDLLAGRAAIIDEGAATPIVMVHGLPGSARDFRWLAPHLSERARCVRVDLPGFGETPSEVATGMTPADQAGFVAAVLSALALPACLLVGHSMGGVFASELVRRHPERVAGVALISSPGVRPHAMLRRLPVRKLSALLATPVTRRLLRGPLRRGFLSSGFSRHFRDAELRRTIDMVARVDIARHAANLRASTKPTAVFWCADDPIIEGAVTDELARVAPDGPRHRYDDGGHNPQKAHAADLADRLFGFARDLGL
jgi:pimeloyl-ACP methyl ester carboxylesterase